MNGVLSYYYIIVYFDFIFPSTKALLNTITSYQNKKYTHIRLFFFPFKSEFEKSTKNLYEVLLKAAIIQY